MSLDQFTEELIAHQSPEAQAIIRVLLAHIAALQAEVIALRAEVAGLRKTPQNSSLPAQHATPARQTAGQKA